MNQHLSSEQIARWMIGECTPQEEQHGQCCPQCSAELTRLRTALSLFRGSVRHWSDRHGSAELQNGWKLEPARHGFRPRPMSWVWAAAALFFLTTIPAYKNMRDWQREADMAKADALLLEHVDTGVSRTVPAPMEPLMRLVSRGAPEGKAKN